MNFNEVIDWQKVNGLVPVIVQNSLNGQVLMHAYMDPLALESTLETGFLYFFSRSKQRLWMKGETSGNKLRLKSLQLDCDNDTLLAKVEPSGPTCHLGDASCFSSNDSELPGWQVIFDLEQKIIQRQNQAEKNSYTQELYKQGINKVAQKVGEEATETVVASLAESNEALANEAADLIYHLLVLLQLRNLSLNDVAEVLQKRAS